VNRQISAAGAAMLHKKVATIPANNKHAADRAADIARDRSPTVADIAPLRLAAIAMNVQFIEQGTAITRELWGGRGNALATSNVPA
jgi:hypothetical protein